jgi:hypothetical protein
LYSTVASYQQYSRVDSGQRRHGECREYAEGSRQWAAGSGQQAPAETGSAHPLSAGDDIAIDAIAIDAIAIDAIAIDAIAIDAIAIDAIAIDAIAIASIAIPCRQRAADSGQWES